MGFSFVVNQGKLGLKQHGGPFPIRAVAAAAAAVVVVSIGLYLSRCCDRSCQYKGVKQSGKINKADHDQWNKQTFLNQYGLFLPANA
jgi:hypothetical protein